LPASRIPTAATDTIPEDMTAFIYANSTQKQPKRSNTEGLGNAGSGYGITTDHLDSLLSG
jgi:hypothetical protein